MQELPGKRSPIFTPQPLLPLNLLNELAAPTVRHASARYQQIAAIEQ